MADLKIRRLYPIGTQQFGDTVLDFTHPETGEPLRRICLIGANGTGKSTVLRWLSTILTDVPFKHPDVLVELERASQTEIEGGRDPYRFEGPAGNRRWWAAVRPEHKANPVEARREYRTADRSKPWKPLRPDRHLDPGRDIVVFVDADPAQDQGVGLLDMPPVRLEDALAFDGEFPVLHTVSAGHLDAMWKLLLYRAHKREADRQDFETRPDNLQRTKAELIAAFDAEHPSVLHALAGVWNRILEPAGLHLDVQNARLPLRLSDNLVAHVVHKGSGKPIAYSALSSGMRRYLFRVGHLFLLFFQRSYDRAFVFIDEPENSLFPDFLFELMDVYESVLPKNAQVFIATHHPIVAAQFEPWERVVLAWDDDGKVEARRGTAPKGDDPNDLLEQDFGLAHLMGPAGRAAWAEYLKLRREARSAPEGAERDRIVAEALRLGRRYDFEAGGDARPADP